MFRYEGMSSSSQFLTSCPQVEFNEAEPAEIPTIRAWIRHMFRDRTSPKYTCYKKPAASLLLVISSLYSLHHAIMHVTKFCHLLKNIKHLEVIHPSSRKLDKQLLLVLS